MRMIERREQPCFPLEPHTAIRIVRHRRRENLDRHVPAQLRVMGDVDLAHGAAAEQVGHPIRADRRPGDRHAVTIDRSSRSQVSNARTTAGSNCVPASARTRLAASSGGIAARYGRADVIASKLSATVMIRAYRWMPSPASLSG